MSSGLSLRPHWRRTGRYYGEVRRDWFETTTTADLSAKIMPRGHQTGELRRETYRPYMEEKLIVAATAGSVVFESRIRALTVGKSLLRGPRRQAAGLL